MLTRKVAFLIKKGVKKDTYVDTKYCHFNVFVGLGGQRQADQRCGQAGTIYISVNRFFNIGFT